MDSYTVTVKCEPGFIHVFAAGTFSVQRTKQLVDRIATEAKHHGVQKVLVDLTGIPGPWGMEARLEIAAYVAAQIPAIKLAAFNRLEVINYLAEWVAQAGGANIRIFSEQSDALNWLLKD